MSLRSGGVEDMCVVGQSGMLVCSGGGGDGGAGWTKEGKRAAKQEDHGDRDCTRAPRSGTAGGVCCFWGNLAVVPVRGTASCALGSDLGVQPPAPTLRNGGGAERGSRGRRQLRLQAGPPKRLRAVGRWKRSGGTGPQPHRKGGRHHPLWSTALP